MRIAESALLLLLLAACVTSPNMLEGTVESFGHRPIPKAATVAIVSTHKVPTLAHDAIVRRVAAELAAKGHARVPRREADLLVWLA